MNAVLENTAIETETITVKKINASIEQKYFDLWKAKKAIEKEMDALKNSIIDGLDEETAQGEKIQCVWVKPTMIFDSTNFAKAHPEIYSVFQKNKAGYYTIKVNEKGE